MAAMARPMRPRDAPFTAADVPDQLQRAARELQAAIQSVRRRRGSTEQATADVDGGDERGGDKENASFLQNLGASGVNDRLDKDACELVADERRTEALDVRTDESESDEEDALALSQLSGLSGISAVSSDDSDAWSVDGQDVTTDEQKDQVTEQVDVTGATLHDEARRALSWIQQDVERQAQDNKVVSEGLMRAVHEISEAIAEAVPAARCWVNRIDEMLVSERAISPEHIAFVAEQWGLALDAWRQQRATEKQEFAERFATFRDECENRLQLLESTHRRECEQLQEDLRHERQVASQRELSHQDVQQEAQAVINAMHAKLERLQCECEDRTAHLLRQAYQLATKPSSFTPVEAPTERVGHDSTRELLDLTTFAKEADLRALQWRMAFEEQSEVAMQTEARLQMLLEDQLVRDDTARQALRRMVPRQSIEVYQERIGWLEEHVRDMQSQIACDHEQFGYEMTKWEQEKQGVRVELDEIRDVSIKLLKMLLIREKLLKKREHKHTNRLKVIEDNLETHRGTLKQVVQTLMEESAALLLVLQQLSVQAVAVPIKPAHVRTTIKQLKRLNRVLDKVEIVAASEDAADDTTVSFSMASNMSEASVDDTAANGKCSDDSRRIGGKSIVNA